MIRNSIQDFYILISAPTHQLVQRVNWSEQISLGRANNLLGRMCFLLQRANLIQEVPAFARHHLTSAFQLYVCHQNQVDFELATLRSICNQYNIPMPLLLKGAAYQQLGNIAGEGRLFSDLDLLTGKKHLDELEARLMAHQWITLKASDYDQKYYREWAHEIPPLQHIERGTTLDIHHNLLPPISGKAPIIERFIHNPTVTHSGFETLRPAALCLHSIIHLLFEEDYSKGCRDLNDLHFLFTENGDSAGFWEDFVELTSLSGYSHEVSIVFRFLRRHYATKIPEDVASQFTLRTGFLSFSWLVDFLFERAFRPRHLALKGKNQTFSDVCLLIRGHFKKMPIKVLCKHVLHKISIGLKKTNQKSTTD